MKVRYGLFVLLCCVLSGCSVDTAGLEARECRRDSDCASGVCNEGYCSLGEDEVDLGNDAEVDFGDDVEVDSGDDVEMELSPCVMAGGDGSCDDGVFCNGVELCRPEDTQANDEGCVSGDAPVLDDGVGCTVDSCDEDNDIIVHGSTDACECQVDSDCDGSCQVGTCGDDFMCSRQPAGAGSACNDGDVATVNDVCDGNGLCRGVLGCPDGMVEVLAGEFERGALGSSLDEQPVRQVFLSLYCIDTYEVTVEQYGRCVSGGDCLEPLIGVSYNYGVLGRERHPINGVDWNDAVAYCEARDARLPTEAEWEKAARGADGRTYPWGEETPSCQYAVMDDGGEGCGEERTWEVGSKPMGVSPYGAYDMAGNVWEWTADFYDEEYYASAPVRDPMGPSAGSFRVIRGGSWFGGGFDLRASYRYDFSPDGADFDLGFRCAR